MARIGIIGCGFMGALHGRTLATVPGAEVRAVCDADGERARRLGEELGARAYTGVPEMFAAERLDGVVVATPDHQHLEAVLAAAAAGCGVLVEKPLATRLDEADAMIEGCRKAGVPLLVGHILRFEVAYGQLRDAVAEGMIGKITSAFARRHAVRQESERLAMKTSVLYYLGVHDFDQILWIHPERPVKVTAHAAHGPVFDRFQTPDVVFTAVEFADGSLAVVESGWSLTEGWASWSTPSTWGPFGDVRFDVTGEDGFLSIDLRTMNLIGVDRREGYRAAETRHWPALHGRRVGALRYELEHFVEVLERGAAPLVTGEDGRRALALCVAAERSLRENRPVQMEEWP